MFHFKTFNLWADKKPSTPRGSVVTEEAEHTVHKVWTSALM